MPAKKKRKSRVVKRYRRNPDESVEFAEVGGFFGSELLGTVVPAVAAFAATRLLTRIAAVQISKRFPKAAPHAGALASIGTFAAAVIVGHKMPYVRDYQESVIIGSGVAAAQSLVQIYVPKLGWVVSDASPDIAATAKKAATAAAPQRQIQQAPQDPNYDDMDDGDWTTYNDAHDQGRYAAPQSNDRQHEPEASTPAADDNDDDIFNMLENDSDLQAAGGVFAP